MRTPARFFREAVEELEKILENDTELKERVITQLSKAFDTADKASGMEKVYIKLGAISKIINSEKKIGEWSNRYFKEPEKKSEFLNSIDNLVNYYEYKYFRSGKYIEVDEDSEIEQATFSKVSYPCIPSYDSDHDGSVLKQLIITKLYIAMFEQAYYTFTEEARYRHFKYFSLKAKSKARKYAEDGHYYIGYPISYFLMTILKMPIKEEGCEIKDSPWSEGFNCFIKTFLLPCKQREKTEIPDQRASIVDISQVHKEIIEEFYTFIAQQLDNLQGYFPDIPRENFILLLIPMIIPSKLSLIHI